LGSTANAERLRQSIAEFKAGKTFPKDLLTNDAKEEDEQQDRGRE
jgi:antitoxin YefM